MLVWDGEGAVGRWRARQPELTAVCRAFRGTLAAKVLICKPGDPEAKGLVERFHDYLERAFLPGRVFVSTADFNTQLADWLVRANHPPAPRVGVSTGRPHPGRYRGDAGIASRRAQHWVEDLDPAAARSLRASRRQRLLGASGRGRPAHRDHRGPGAGSGLVWRHPGRRPRADLGQTSDDL